MLKNLPKIAVIFFTFIINSCLKLQYFPETWKMAKVTPIPKPGKPPNEIGNYRPISLLSSLGKIFEQVLKDKLTDFINENNILPAEQFGFRKFHGTTHPIQRICNHIKSNFINKKSAALVLFDVEKAFDSVWHNGLLIKLIDFKFPIQLIKIIQSFLKNRFFCVCINNEFSDLTEVPAGVPQGSVIGPILFNIYVSDVPKFDNCHYAMYADDIGIYYSHKSAHDIVSKMQSALNHVANYFHRWKIKLNVGKTQAIFFTKKRSSCNLPSINLNINRHDINWSNTVKYLGVVLDKKLIFRDHIHHINNKYNIAIKMLYPLINRKSELSTENKLVICKVIFQSIMLYACPVWGTCAKTHIKTLQIQQNKLLRMMLNLPWDYSTIRLHNENKIEMIFSRIEKLNDKFKIKCSYSNNQLILDLLQPV